MKKVTVYCGMSVEGKCGEQLHPVNEVLKAKDLIMSDKDEVAHSNNPDFISAVKYIGKKNNVETEFFLDGKSYGDSVEEIFKDFNQSSDLISDWGSE